VKGFNYSRVKPTPKENPRIVSLSPPALSLLDLDSSQIEKDHDSVLYLSGNKDISNSEPIAHCYCGFQFGSFAGQLGDGRAITLGDIKNQRGELWELQLKGSGLTPYSRFADGKAVLRSSIREYLCSEALWALGIPTTRAASLIVSDTVAERDPMENGKVIMEKCAVVMRLAPSFWRFGSFEIFKGIDEESGRRGPSNGLEKEMMPSMLDYLLVNYFPDIQRLEKEKGYLREDCWLEMYYEIARRTASLVALWQCYGFCHGVLNTDNMSILGLTIDFGPFGFIDYFDKGFICNHSDESGRYSYENQPNIGKWNLNKLAEALQSHLPVEKMKEFVSQNYDKVYREHYFTKMREKLGFYCVETDQDISLIEELFEVMHLNASDFTNTFRKLTHIKIPNNLSQLEISQEILEEFVGLSPPKEVLAMRYKPHFSEEQLQKVKELAETNIQLLLRMGITPTFIDHEEEKMKKFKEALNIDEEKVKKEIVERWKKWLNKYSDRLFKEAQVLIKEDEESKSLEFLVKEKIDSIEKLQTYRIKKMNEINPIYILRNYMAEEAIQKAENGDFSGVNKLLKILLNPFEPKEGENEEQKYQKCPPKWAAEICVSCSS